MEQRQVNEMKSGLTADFIKNPQRRALIERWSKWIPGKVKNPYQKWVMAQLYENQLGELKNFKEKHLIGEDTTTVNTAPFIKYTFPLLRRVWPSLIAPEIVSVQPMTAPVGAVFYFELKYGITKGSATAGQKLIKDFNRFYSGDFIDVELVGTGDGATTTFNHTNAFLPVQPGTVKIVAGTVVATDDGNGNLTGTGVAAGSTINYTSGAVHIVYSAAPANGVAINESYRYNNEGTGATVPQVNIDISLISVTAKSRKLKALWSSEAADDLKSLHGVDAEQELVAGLGSELALEIDREIIQDLVQGATGVASPLSFNATVPSGMKDTDWYRSIITPITQTSNQIGKNQLRGAANFMVMSYDVASIIEQIGTDAFFRPVFANQNADTYAPAEAPQTWGIMKMGTLQQRWMAYKDPYLSPVGTMLLGYKGNSFVDAGYVWAPYVPLQVTATFLDPNDFEFRKGLRTRYAKLMARPEFYATVNVTNLPSTASGSFGPPPGVISP